MTKLGPRLRSVGRKRHDPIQGLHKTNHSGSSCTRHKLPSRTHRSRGPSPGFYALETSARRIATRRKQRISSSRGLSCTWPHQTSSTLYEQHVQAKRGHRRTQNGEVETGCGSHFHFIRFGLHTLQIRLDDSGMTNTGAPSYLKDSRSTRK